MDMAYSIFAFFLGTVALGGAAIIGLAIEMSGWEL